MKFFLLLLAASLIVGFRASDMTVTEICPGVGIQPRTADFQPGGIILTSFDSTSIWVYNIDRDTRYPLPDTLPCGVNCRLSPDATWVTYLNPRNFAYSKMRLDGTERTLITEYATDVEWWSNDRYLIWTPGHRAYLQTENTNEQEHLNVNGIVSVQPGGRWGLQVQQEGDSFVWSLLNLETRDFQGVAAQIVNLSEVEYPFQAAAWSPNGNQLVYTAQGPFDSTVNTAGAELYSIRPGDSQPLQLTSLTERYGAARINGSVSKDLSWSPDSQYIAFWVIELLGADMDNNTGNAVLHVLNVATNELKVYCGFSTTDHTPFTPRIAWSPDSTHLAFGANIPGDDKGYLLLTLNIETGIFTELSNGIFPALGKADIIAWGRPPR